MCIKVNLKIDTIPKKIIVLLSINHAGLHVQRRLPREVCPRPQEQERQWRSRTRAPRFSPFGNSFLEAT